ncbi:class V chitinase CHIT5a-like [Aristolochia californica]|uniref:class V chitinase CHIT5a-like n=1 Tax=Aristolochia californica TaxID=171875 RepID=UPI0035DE2A52
MASVTSTAAQAPGIRGGYWFPNSDVPVSAINTSYYTHIYYAFLLPDPNTYEIVVNNADDPVLRSFTSTLHGKNPPVKTILSIGGGSNDATVFSQMVSDPKTRSSFIESAVGVARGYNFDGMDLDWELPANQTDMNNLGLLFQEWKAVIDYEASSSGRQPLLLTAAVNYAVTIDGSRTYPSQAINNYVSWVNAMCYDYHGSWDTSQTGTLAALYDPNGSRSTSYGIQSWLNIGVQPEKVIMGLPLYGRSWTLKDPQVHGIGAPAVGIGPGPDGAPSYKLVTDLNAQNRATVVYDTATVSVYSYWGTSWISYDDERSVAVKIRYAKGQKLGGYFFWAVQQDKDWIISKQASDVWSSN